MRRRGVSVKVFAASACPDRLPPSDLVIDAAYGTGYRASCRAPWTPPAIGGRPVLAVDIPSGLDASTGGHAGEVLAADRTVTFQALKPGLLFGDGPSLSGEVEVVDIGLDVSRATSHLVDAGDVAAWLPRRPVDAHKWSTAVRIVAGSPGMLGAAGLAARGAARWARVSSQCRHPVAPHRCRSRCCSRRFPTPSGPTRCSTGSLATARWWWVPDSVGLRRPWRRSAG